MRGSPTRRLRRSYSRQCSKIEIGSFLATEVLGMVAFRSGQNILISVKDLRIADMFLDATSRESLTFTNVGPAMLHTDVCSP